MEAQILRLCRDEYTMENLHILTDMTSGSGDFNMGTGLPACRARALQTQRLPFAGQPCSVIAQN